MDRPASRVLALSLALGALIVPVAGCGSDKKDTGADPLDNALGYVPPKSPLVISFTTDPKGGQFRAARKIVEKFPFANQIEQSLLSSLQSGSVNYGRDLKPLLGNQFVVAAPDVRSLQNNGNSSQDFVGAIQAKDGKKLQDAVKKEKSKAEGSKDGAKIYKGKTGSSFAVKDDVLIVAGSRALLDKALAARGSGNRYTESDFDKSTEGLPKGSAVRLSTDVEAILAADPNAARARKVKWVKALRTFGLSASVANDKINVDFNLATDSSGLTEADLPIASGDQSPDVIKRKGEIGFGLRDPGQVVTFAENAGQAVSPAQFGSYETAKKTVEAQLKINLQKDVIDQLRNGVSVSVDPSRQVAVKGQVKDPAAFRKSLAKVTKVLPAIIQSSSGSKPKISHSGGLYEARTPSRTIAYGLVGDTFVFADSAAAARAVAKAPTATVAGAKGSLAMQADAEQVVVQALKRMGASGQGRQLGLGAALGGSLIAGPLGALTGSAKADTSGITGQVSLAFD
jgi:hypothetical protein